MMGEAFFSKPGGGTTFSSGLGLDSNPGGGDSSFSLVGLMGLGRLI